MIERAKFENFKALRDVEVTFGSRLTVLVGPNGSGKTSVLRGLDFLCRVLAAKPQPGEVFHPTPLDDIFSGDPDHDLVLDASEAIAAKMRRGVRITANPKPKSPNPVQPTYPISWRHYRESAHGRREYLHGSQQSPEGIASFSSAQLLQLAPLQLAANTLTTTVPPHMELSGRGLASVLAFLKLYEEERFNEVVNLFREVIPQVKRVRVDRVPVNGQGMGEGLLFDLPTRAGVRASAMSDGTLYVLGLLTVIVSPHRPKVLLLDDLDHGLHPKAQMELLALLRRLLDQHPELQIVATSHSPYILNKLRPDEVRVSVLRDDGSAFVAELKDHPQFEKWKDVMTPGEFWSSAGEDWVKQLPAYQTAP